MTFDLAHPIRSRWLFRSALCLLGALSVGVLAMTLSSCKGKGGTTLPPGGDPSEPEEEVCDCPEPSTADPDITGDDDDTHETFDLALETWYSAADGGSVIHEQQDILLGWKLTYVWEGCGDSTPGRSGEFTLIHSLTQDGVDLLADHPERTVTLELRMGEEATGSLLFKGAEIPPPRDTLYWDPRINVTDHQECTTDDSLDLTENNWRPHQIPVTDCPCPGGLASSDARVSALEWDDTLGELSWQTAYEVVRCGEEDPVESGKFTSQIRITDASGAVLHEGTVPGESMTAGAPPDDYSYALPVEVSSGDTLTVSLTGFTPALCPGTTVPTATLAVP